MKYSLLPTTVEEEGLWWCNAHQREATHLCTKTGKIRCNPRLGGISMPCIVVFAPVEIVDKY